MVRIITGAVTTEFLKLVTYDLYPDTCTDRPPRLGEKSKTYCPFALKLYDYPLHQSVCNNRKVDHKG